MDPSAPRPRGSSGPAAPDVLATALSALPDAILVVREGVIVFENAAVRELFGSSPGVGANGRLWMSVQEPAVSRAIATRGATDRGLATLANGRAVEWSVRRLDHTWVFRFADRSDDAACVATAFHTNRLVAQLYEGAPCGHHALDANGRFVWMNDTELGWLGYDREEVLNQPFVGFLSEGSRATFERSFPPFLETGVLRDTEFEFLRKDGSIMVGLVSATAITEPDGRFVMSRSVVIDITERKRVEAALRASEERYRHLYEATPVMLHSIDGTGRLVAVSDCWLSTLGYTRGEVIGRRSTDFLDEESRERARRSVIPQFFESGHCQDVPYRMVRRDGTVIDVLLSANAERDAEGRVVRSLAVILDVTERLRVERELAAHREHLQELVAARTGELEAANRELETFAYSVSHDLRAPVRAVQGFSQLLAEKCGASLGEEGRVLLRRVRAAADRQHTLIEDLLGLSRVGRVEMRRQTVDLAEIARNVLAERAAAEPGRRVVAEVGPLPPANGDPALLTILLENLIGNAWKYTGCRVMGHVWVDALPPGAGPTVYRVRDDGAGFDPTRAEHLFEPFVRLHPTSDYPGSGIGLATAARIIQRHGGRIWAEGVVDGGATVSFTLE